MSEFSNNCSYCFSCDGCDFNACPTGDCVNGNQYTAYADGQDNQWFEDNHIEICNDCQKKIEAILAKKKIKNSKKLEFVEQIIEQGLEKYQKFYE